MTSKSVAKPGRETEVAAASRAPHPLDAWLKRQLETLYGEREQAALPPGIAALAARLEQRLRQTGGGAIGEEAGGTADRERGAKAGKAAKRTARGGQR